MKRSKAIFIICALLLAINVNAQSIGELKDKIELHNSNIKKLEEEIRGYQLQIEGLGKEADTLKRTLAQLDLSRKKIEADLTVTQTKIENTNLEIKELSFQIDDKSERIGDSRRVIAQSLSSISRSDSTSLIETLLSSQTLAQAWNGAEELLVLQTSVRDRIHELRDIRTDLETNKKKTEQKKAQLLSLQHDLANQKKVLAETVKEKNSILASTKNTEANYKKILAQKEEEKEAFEKELFAYESALKVAIDRSLIPAGQKGLLSWPLTSVRITQYFGKTVDAQRLYASGTHGGMDFAAPIGTPIFAALSGVVTDTEATRIRAGCQYGKYVLIKHPNGISTLYGHLSLVNVSPGQEVRTGDVIGYSGSTGYATGPHLHLGLYATQGIRIVDARELGSRNCAGIKTIAAPLNAYLDPLIYL